MEARKLVKKLKENNLFRLIKKKHEKNWQKNWIFFIMEIESKCIFGANKNLRKLSVM